MFVIIMKGRVEVGDDGQVNCRRTLPSQEPSPQEYNSR